MGNELITIAALWLIYGVLGFIIETTYVSILQKKFVQRGFLSGPIIPIYAFGATTIVLLLGRLHNVLVVFILGILLASILEYITHFLMEKLLHMKLWDYSHMKYNLNGRICLLNSSLFGVLAVVLVFVVNPFIVQKLSLIPPHLLKMMVVLGLALTAVDFTYSTLAAISINTHLQSMEKIGNDIDTAEFKSYIGSVEKKYKKIKKRLINAYPEMKSTKLQRIFEELKEKYRKRT